MMKQKHFGYKKEPPPSISIYALIGYNKKTQFPLLLQSYVVQNYDLEKDDEEAKNEHTEWLRFLPLSGFCLF